MSTDPEILTAPTQVTRRDLLRALGIGGASLAAGAGVAAAQSTPEAESPPAPKPGIRQPGGPTVAGKTFELKGDVEEIFRFVRDEVRYEAYAGALRGPLGTLWGLAGNSVDQAQLLAAMLNEAKITTRFAIGSIDDSAGTTLLQSMNLDLETAFEHAAKVHALPNTADREAELANLTAEQQQVLDDLAARAEELIAEARVQLTDGIETIISALDRAGVTLPENEMSLPERERTQHVWVQYASGTEWVDLDPSLADAESGQTFATAESTLDALPDDHFHTVTFRLTAEKIAGEQAVRSELLSYTAKSQDLVGTPLTLLHVPPNSLKGLGTAIEGTLEGTIQYIPHLAIGATNVVAGTDRITLVTGGGLTDVFGGSSADGDTIGEWFEADIASPDLPVRYVMREVFDRIGAGARDETPPDVSRLPPAEITNYGDGSGDVFMPMVQIWSMIAMSGDVPMSYFEQDYAIDDMYANLSLLNFGFHLSRESLARGLVASGSPRVFVDRPNITGLVLTANDLTPEQPAVVAAIDLLHQSVVSLPWNDSANGASTARLAAGVLAHVAERVTTSGTEATAPASIGSEISVGRILEEARRQTIETAVLLPGAVISEVASMSPRAERLVSKALNEGFLVIVPSSPVDLGTGPITGWWQVHLESAETRDVLETGQSTNQLGYATTVRVSVQATPAMRLLAMCKMFGIYLRASVVISILGNTFGAGVVAGGGGGIAGAIGGGIGLAGALSGGAAAAGAAIAGC